MRQLELPGIDPLAEMAANTRQGLEKAPLRFAVPVSVQVTPATHGTWEQLADGRLWRLRLVAPGATDLNLGFGTFWLPEGATMHIASESEDYFQGPYTARDNKPHGQFWAPVVPGESAIVELFVPSQAQEAQLVLTQVGCGFLNLFGRRQALAVAKAGACNIDVVCPQGDPWRNEIRSVATYTLNGAFTCSGTLIMDTAADFRPFFLTANHCDITTANASSMVVYWNFQSPLCNQHGGGSLNENQSGATFRAAKADVDFALVELDDMPDPVFRVYYAGWDRSGLPPLGAVGIHHPSSDEKSISFSATPLITVNSCIAGGGILTHWQVIWNAGVTEKGSSGSGIWDPVSHLLVGFLSGGDSSCASPNGADCYGKFSVAWASGSSASSRLSDWLDALNTGATTVAGRDHSVADIRVNGPPDFGVVCPGAFSDQAFSIFNIGTIDLTVFSVTEVSGGASFSVLPNPRQPFLIQPGDHVDVTVRFEPSAPGSASGTLRISSNDFDQPELDIMLTGVGGKGTIATVIADAGNFGNVCVGAFKDAKLAIHNRGGCDLVVSDITSSSIHFLVPGVMSFPLVVQAGGSLGIPIRFQPLSAGPKSGMIAITSNDPDTPIKMVDVSGTAPTGHIRVTGSTDFGHVCPGDRAEQTISICNVGLCELRVSRVYFVPPCPDFALVNNPFPTTISHDFCIGVVIRFTPTSCGSKSCNLRIESDDPDTPVINLTVTATAPCADIDVPPDLAFGPEVIQSDGACTTSLPFPISNKGQCNLTITSISIGGPNAADFSLSGLPSFPIILEPGHIAGEGDLNVVFAPTALDRDREATLTVTYATDPTSGATTSVTRKLCGEGVHTGARVLVTHGGIPILNLEKIHLQRINANRNRARLDTQDQAMRLPLVTVTPAAPCEPFQYHREYGTIANPIQLLPGSYQITVTAIINGRRQSKSVGFNVDTCDFNANIVVEF